MESFAAYKEKYLAEKFEGDGAEIRNLIDRFFVLNDITGIEGDENVVQPVHLFISHMIEELQIVPIKNMDSDNDLYMSLYYHKFADINFFYVINFDISRKNDALVADKVFHWIKIEVLN